MKKRYLNYLIEIIYLGIIFLIPIYFGFIFSSANPFDLQRLILFKILLGLLFFLSVFKAFLLESSLDFRLSLRKFFKKYYLIPLLSLIFFLLSLLWSFNPNLSWVGSLERQLGINTWIFLGLFSVLLSFNLLSSPDFKKSIYRIFLVSGFSATIVSLYAVFQFWGIDFLSWNEPAVITKRAFSSLGQPNLLGSFLLLNIFIIPYLFKNTKNKYFRLLFILSGGLQFLALLYSASRGAYLGFLFSLLIFIIYWCRQRRLKFFIVIIFIGLIFLFPRVKSMGGFSSRVDLWSASLAGVLDNPWGYGLENQKEVFINYYQPDWGVFNKVNVVFDRAHNFILDTLLVGGFVALALLMAWLLFTYKMLVSNIRKREDGGLSLGLTLAFTSFFISLLFGFSSFVSLLYLVSFFSIISVNDYQSKKEVFSLIEEQKLKFHHRIFLITLALVLGAFFFREINKLKSDYYFYVGQRYFYQNQVPSAIISFSYLRQNSLVNREYYYQIANLFFDNYSKFPDQATRFLAQEELKEIAYVLDKSIEKSFTDQVFWAQVYSILGKGQSSQALFDVLISRSPFYPLLYYRQAQAHLFAGNKELALVNYYKVLELLPVKENIEGDINLRAYEEFKALILEEINNLDL